MKPYQIPFVLIPSLAASQVIQAAQEIDDASRMNTTWVSEVIDIKTENDVRLALMKAQVRQNHISIAGRRHTMGGQTFEKGNIVLNMLPYHNMSLDLESGLLTVESGATWTQVQKYLDPKARSVWVMQSDNVFTVGGTLSANAHGWQPRQGPIASTVESIRIMLASGEIKSCSRQENASLFHAVLGGYGLLGVILDVRLRTVPNKLYRQSSYFLSAKGYADLFKKAVTENPNVELAYGRLSIDRKNFLTEAGLHTFTAASPQPPALPAMEQESMVKLKETIFHKSAQSDAGKRRRWILEKRMAAYQAGHSITRNTVMSPDFRVVWHPTPESRDILQEYFVPYEKVDDFIESLRFGIRRYQLNLLNVTLRDVKQDPDTLLAYAKSDVCALVLFFSQPPTAQAEETMRAFTQSTVDRAIGLGGSFYLPYRLTYSQEQFMKAYPRAKEFAAIKHHYDPDGLFSSQFSHYLFATREGHS